MLRRHREYYVGGRSRRGVGRAAVVFLGVLVIGGATAFTAFMPAMGFAPASAPGTPTATTMAVAPTPIATADQRPSPAPSGGIEPPSSTPPTTPAFSTPPPCRPPENIQPAKVVSHGSRDRKVIALTFDDGTNPENTKQILRILKKHKVNATFFPTGRSMERFPDIWKTIARASFPIANHTYSHESLKGLCYEPQRHQLAKAKRVFFDLGIPQLPVFRPPYELYDTTTRIAVAGTGIQAVVLWGVDTRDWQGYSAASIRRTALNGNKGSIVLMHTGPEATAAALPGIIKGYRKRGFEFVTIGQLLGIDGPVPFPPKEP